MITLALDARHDVGRVRRRDGRLGHQEGGTDPAIHQWTQPFLFLLRAAVADEHFHVARIRCGAVEHFGGEFDAPHMLCTYGVFEVGQSGAPILVVLMLVGWHEHIPQTRSACLFLEVFDDRNHLPAIAALVLLIVDGNRRLNMLLREFDDTVEPVALTLG